METYCLIISGGDYAPLGDDTPAPGLIIACDKGYLYADRLNIRPDLIIGDFDSAPVPCGDIPVMRVPCRKDDTDTMLAVKFALNKGYRDLTIACAFGGRLDHTLANLQAGAFAAERGGRARLAGSDTEAFISGSGSISLRRRPGWSLSLFSLSDQCTGVSISGTNYDCGNISLTNRFPLGISNSWRDDEAVISLNSGIILIVLSKLKDNEHI